MLKKILIVFVLFLLSFFIFKDQILKAGILHFLNKKTTASKAIGKAKLLLDGFIIEDFSLSQGELDIKIGKAIANFNILKRSIKDLKISNCNLKVKNINIDLALEKSKDGLYILEISSVKLRDKEIKNISIPLIIGEDTISFYRVNTDFLGYAALVSGILNYQNYGSICLKLSLKNTSFKNLINFFNKEEDFALIGDFNGKIKFCMDKGKISELEGDFNNAAGGAINIEKGASLGFLQRYLDKASQDALVDNFKHYTYNKGSIMMNKEDDAIIANLDFGSEELGRRNVWINLHNILGGGK